MSCPFTQKHSKAIYHRLSSKTFLTRIGIADSKKYQEVRVPFLKALEAQAKASKWNRADYTHDHCITLYLDGEELFNSDSAFAGWRVLDVLEAHAIDRHTATSG